MPGCRWDHCRTPEGLTVVLRGWGSTFPERQFLRHRLWQVEEQNYPKLLAGGCWYGISRDHETVRHVWIAQFPWSNSLRCPVEGGVSKPRKSIDAGRSVGMYNLEPIYSQRTQAIGDHSHCVGRPQEAWKPISRIPYTRRRSRGATQLPNAVDSDPWCSAFGENATKWLSYRFRLCVTLLKGSSYSVQLLENDRAWARTLTKNSWHRRDKMKVDLTGGIRREIQ